jgi:radical SAM protein with 4Fe4S-binding SPASM domain
MLLWKEFWIVLRLLTLRRVVNFLLLKISFFISKIIKKPVVWAYPYAVSIEPTTACNLECPACPSGLRDFTRPTGNMKEETFENILQQLYKYLLHINFYFQGEPLIHPKIYEWIKMASQKNIYTMISTNAHFLSEKNAEKLVQSGLHKIIISIDGMTQDVYEQYRVKGNVNKVFEGVENILSAKEKYHSRTPIIVLQWIAFEHNLHQIPMFIDYCKQHKLDYQIKTAQVYSTEQLSKLVPKDERYSRYLLDKKELKIKGKLENHCWRMWASCVFTKDGMVVPCCFDKDAKYEMGDIKTTTFTTLWHSTPYQNFRKKILRSRQNIDICNNCSEGTKVWV